MKKHLLIFILGALYASSLPAAAQGRIAISKLPFTISKPGNYYVSKDLVLTKALPSSVAAAISIAASDVDLDLNGRTLSATAPFGDEAAGVSDDRTATFRTGITVRNGTIRQFGTGVAVASSLTDATCRLVYERVVVEALAGTNSRIGLYIVGNDSVVRSCAVRSDFNVGISVDGANCRVLDVECAGVGAGQALIVTGKGTVVEQSRFRQGGTTPAGQAIALGANAGSPGAVVNCLITGCFFQGYTSAVNASGASFSFTYRDNTFVNCTAPTTSSSGATAANAGGNFP